MFRAPSHCWRGTDMIAGEAQTRGRTHQYMSCGWHWILSSLSLFAGDLSCTMDPTPSLGTNALSCPGLTGCLVPSAHRYCEQGCQEHTADTLQPVPEAFTKGRGQRGTPWYPKLVTSTFPKLFLRSCCLWRTQQSQVSPCQPRYCGSGTCFPPALVLLIFDPTR